MNAIMPGDENNISIPGWDRPAWAIREREGPGRVDLDTRGQR